MPGFVRYRGASLQTLKCRGFIGPLLRLAELALMRSVLRSTLVTTAAYGALTLLVVFSAVPKGATRFFTWPWIFYGQLLLLLPVGLLGYQLWKRPQDWRPTWTILGAVGLAVGLSVALSHRPEFSFEAALFLWGGLAWCGVIAVAASELAASARPDCERLLVRLIGAAILVPVATSLMGWMGDLAPTAAVKGWGSVLKDFAEHRNPHPQGHWNYTGGYALLAITWLIALVLTERGWVRRFWLVGVMGCAVMLLSASSRGAVLGVTVGVAAALGMTFVGRKRSRRLTMALAAVGVAVAVVLFAINPRLRSIVINPESALSPNEGDVQRIAMLQGGWLLAKERPWIGHGPGMTPFVYPEVRAQLVGGVETSYQLHNGPLHMTVESGLLGLACALAFGGALLVGVLRWLRASQDGALGRRRVFALSSACGIAGYAGLFVTDYQLNVVAILGLMGLYAGVVLAAPSANPLAHLGASSRRLRQWAGGALMLGAVVSVILLIPEWRARQLFWSAWAEMPSESDPAVIVRLRAACRLSPTNTHYLNHLGFRLALNAEAMGDIPGGPLREEARQILARSLALDPAQEPVHAALGWLWRDEDPRKAEMHFRRALALLPDRDTLYFGLALSRLAQGDVDGTCRSLALECLVNPMFVASPVWTQEPLLPLWPKVASLLRSDYAFVLRHPQTPAWRKPQIAYSAAFARWWKGGEAPGGDELLGADAAQRRFFEELRGGTISDDEPRVIRLLRAASVDLSKSAEILRDGGGSSLSEAARTGAEARLQSRPAALSDLLRSPAPQGAGVMSQRVVRGHFAIMHRVLDGPAYADFAPRVLDSFTIESAGFLFPMRGTVPSPVICDLMKTAGTDGTK